MLNIEMEKDYCILLSHPGETLKELLLSYQMEGDDLANNIDIDKQLICDILNGKQNITKGIADKFATVFNLPASFWLKLQEQYDNDLKKIKDKK